MDLTKGTHVNMVQSESSNENIIEIEIPFPLFQYLSSDNCNLQNICRICLSVNDQALLPLFSTQGNSVLADMVMAISEVQMSAEDGLPSKVCPLCQAEVMSYYEFKMKCVKSDYTLKSVLKGEFVTEEESTTHSDDLKTGPEQDIDVKDNNDIENKVNLDVKREIDDTGLEFLENLQDTMSDDEALCIVRDTKHNEKEITIIDNNTHSALKEVAAGGEDSKNFSKKTKHSCSFCPKGFHKVKSLQAHISKHHAELAAECPYPCGHCKESFNSEFDLKIHGMLHNEKSIWNCTECGKMFSAKTALRRHIQRHMKWKRFPCGACGKSFVELYALRRHARVHSGVGPEKKHACQLCDKRFTSIGELSAHGASHSGARGSVCGACGAAFASARLLASHARVHSSHKPHECTHCGKRFRHESTRNTHVRTHTGERPYVCAQCGKTFIQCSNLTLHMRTHTGERPYSCNICERKFSSGSTLKAHKRTHTGERPYSCNVCGKSFARVNMKLHMRLHSGSRPHACPACPKRFVAAGRLRDHYRLHTGEKPFECDMCIQKFSTKSQLIKHVKKHDRKKKTKKGMAMTPVTVTDNRHTNLQPAHKQDNYQFPEVTATNMPDINLCPVHEVSTQPSGLVYQDGDDNVKTEVIVLGNDSLANGVSYINDVNYSNDVNLVTVNEGEVSISAASTEGTTVKLYQYDQSLLQIHTGGGQLTISRISSKLTANF